MRTLNRVADRLLGRFVPSAKAEAACVEYPCSHNGCFRRCCDGKCGNCYC